MSVKSAASGASVVEEEVGFYVFIKGIPWKNNELLLLEWLAEKNVHPYNGVFGIHYVYENTCVWTGDAYVELGTREDQKQLMHHNHTMMDHRYLEFHEAERAQFEDDTYLFKSEGEYCLKLRGLPYDAGEKEVREFFKDLSIESILICMEKSNRSTGDAFVTFGDINDVTLALAKHRDRIGDRYIEIFLSSNAMLQTYNAIVSNGTLEEITYKNRRYNKKMHPVYYTDPNMVAMFENPATLAYPFINTNGARYPFITPIPAFNPYISAYARIPMHPALAQRSVPTNYVNANLSNYSSPVSHTGSNNYASPRTAGDSMYNAHNRFGTYSYIQRCPVPIVPRMSTTMPLPSWCANKPFLRLRGLPFKVSDDQIREFFNPLKVVSIVKDSANGNWDGVAYVEFKNTYDAEQGLKRNRQKIDHRYIEIFWADPNWVRSAVIPTLSQHLAPLVSPQIPYMAPPTHVAPLSSTYQPTILHTPAPFYQNNFNKNMAYYTAASGCSSSNGYAISKASTSITAEDYFPNERGVNCDGAPVSPPASASTTPAEYDGGVEAGGKGVYETQYENVMQLNNKFTSASAKLLKEKEIALNNSNNPVEYSSGNTF